MSLWFLKGWPLWCQIPFLSSRISSASSLRSKSSFNSSGSSGYSICIAAISLYPYHRVSELPVLLQGEAVRHAGDVVRRGKYDPVFCEFFLVFMREGVRVLGVYPEKI